MCLIRVVSVTLFYKSVMRIWQLEFRCLFTALLLFFVYDLKAHLALLYLLERLRIQLLLGHLLLAY